MKLYRTSGRLPAVALLAAAVWAFAAAPLFASQATQPLRYERVTKTVQLRNVASRDGAIVSELRPGTLVAVYDERSGYLSVEVPGGMGVWIYGKYARETEVPGVLEITAQNINMRPLPSSDVSSFPLKEKLHRGDRVRMITRANPGRPLESDWVKVWSPAGTRAWMRGGSTERLAASDDGKLLWTSAVTAASAARPAGAKTAGASAGATTTRSATTTQSPTRTAPKTNNAMAADAAAPKAAASGQAPQAGASSQSIGETMSRAEAMMADIRTGASSDFAGARSAYQSVIDVAPRSVDAGIAKARLEELTAREDVVRLESDMRAFEERRREEVARAQAELAAAQKNKDPLWGRLQARGWLEREEGDTGNVSYVIRWAGRITTEVVCTSGRYDLSVFDGYEIGVTGVTTRAAIEASLGQASRPVRIDASRIEVISGRYAR